MHHRIHAFTYGCLLAILCGCSAKDKDDASSDRVEDAGVDEPTYLGLAKPRDGFQIRSVGAEIAPGEDLEYCEVGRLPGDESETYYVKSFELGNETGSHHLLVSAAVPGSPAEEKLRALGEGAKVGCLSAENAFGNDAFVGAGGSQQPYSEIVMPDRVGREYRGGQWVVFDYHYLNTRDAPIRARSAVNFHLTERESIDHVARGFNFTNYTIATQPGERGSYTGECRFRADVMLGDITRHTHRWGTDFSVSFSGGARDGEEIWTSNDWQHDTIHTFDPPIRVAAGEGLRFRCDYQNDTPRPLRFGTSATDEMCILFGTIWEADGRAALGSQNCAIVWQDADSVGHPAHEAGGFPKPSEAEVSACLSAVTDNPCSRCRCEACATPAIQCSTDPDCSAIAKCYAACPPGADCARECLQEADAHSSGLGSLNIRSNCFQSRCASECM